MFIYNYFVLMGLKFRLYNLMSHFLVGSILGKSHSDSLIINKKIIVEYALNRTVIVKRI